MAKKNFYSDEKMRMLFEIKNIAVENKADYTVHTKISIKNKFSLIQYYSHILCYFHA